MLSCGLWLNGKQFDVEQRLLSFPCDNSVKRLTHFSRSTPFRHAVVFFHDTLWSCPPSQSGFHVSAPIHRLIFDITSPTYLHVDLMLRKSTLMSMWLVTKPDKNFVKKSLCGGFDDWQWCVFWDSLAQGGHEVKKTYPKIQMSVCPQNQSHNSLLKLWKLSCLLCFWSLEIIGGIWVSGMSL